MMDLFYPKLNRLQEYKKKDSGAYYSYQKYHDQVLLDCQNRCVYCDIRIDEIGFEGFALDHFRPQDLFPYLKNNPYNLVIACPKCNRGKWNHWPLSATDAGCHNDIVGFIDPFLDDRSIYFDIKITGELIDLKPPSTYLIKLLNLNRPTRVLVRKRRIIKNQINELHKCLSILMDDIQKQPIKEDNKEQLSEKIKIASTIVSLIQSLSDSK
ncbi:HNH endonuclease [Chromobacterium piscinae]|uniref:HNH endonuclease n=1 Tax=Chromobacterium piscinae TaxID=686831 RepID=UPI003F7DFBEE